MYTMHWTSNRLEKAKTRSSGPNGPPELSIARHVRLWVNGLGKALASFFSKSKYSPVSRSGTSANVRDFNCSPARRFDAICFPLMG